MPGTELQQQHSEFDTIRFWNRFNFPSLGYTLLPLLLAVRYVNAPPDTRTYGPSHWFLDYHNGFMRRALVGELFTKVGFLSWQHIFMIEAVILAIGICLTYILFRQMLVGNINERRLSSFLLAAPAFLPHMALMGGEIDNILYIVLLLAYWLIIYVGHNLGLFLATLLIVAGLAMHEAFLLMFYPLIFVLIFHLLHRRRLTASGVGIHCAVVLLSFTAILAHGKFHGDQATWVAHAQQRTDMPIEGAVFIPLHNTLAEQLSFVRHRYTRSLIIRVLLTLALSLPYGIALWRLLVGTIQRQNYSALFRQIITATFFLPLCLIPLGHDVMRWIAALCINMSIYVLVIYQENKSDTGQTAEAVRALRYWSDSPATASTFLYLLIIGPWGLAGTHLFSNITRVLISTRDFLN